jgi:hypothetical protein
MASNSWKTYKIAVAFNQFRLIYKFFGLHQLTKSRIILRSFHIKDLRQLVTTYISGLGHAHKIQNLTNNTVFHCMKNVQNMVEYSKKMFLFLLVSGLMLHV